MRWAKFGKVMINTGMFRIQSFIKDISVFEKQVQSQTTAHPPKSRMWTHSRFMISPTSQRVKDRRDEEGEPEQ